MYLTTNNRYPFAEGHTENTVLREANAHNRSDHLCHYQSATMPAQQPDPDASVAAGSSDDDDWIVEGDGSGTDCETETETENELGNVPADIIMTASGKRFDTKVWEVASHGMPQDALHPLPVERKGYRWYLNTNTGKHMRAVVVSGKSAQLTVHVRDSADACYEDLKALFGSDFKPKLNEAKASELSSEKKGLKRPNNIFKRYGDGPIYNHEYAVQVIATFASQAKLKRAAPKNQTTADKSGTLDTAQKSAASVQPHADSLVVDAPKSALAVPKQVANSKSMPNESGNHKKEIGIPTSTSGRAKNVSSTDGDKPVFGDEPAVFVSVPVSSTDGVGAARKRKRAIFSAARRVSPNEKTSVPEVQAAKRRRGKKADAARSTEPGEMVELAIRIPVGQSHLIQSILKSLAQ